MTPGQFGHEAHCDVYNQPKRKITGYNLHGHTQWRGHPDGDNYYSFYAGKVEPRDNAEAYIDDDWAQVLDAIDFMQSYDGDQPLCIYLPILYPHPPYGVEEPYFSMIDRSQVKPPIKPYDNWEDKPSLLRGLWERQRMQGWSEQRLVELKATYLGMCARVDAQYGLLLTALRQAGLYDDTAVFFFSDHGDFTGDYGLVEKTQNTFQDCLVRVPFVIKPPAAVAVQPRVSLQQLDGPEHTKAIMLRTKQWKYVYRVCKKHELYDLVNDPDETINRIDDPAAADGLHALKLRMLQFFVETADVVPYQADERNFRS